MPALPPALPAVPVLETERLLLRGHRLADFPDCAAMWADPAITRFIGGEPFPAEQAWAMLLRYFGHWSLLGFGYWAIEEKASGRFAGELGFADYKRDLVPSIAGLPELGWALVADMQGRGYATEAVQAVLAWGRAHLAPTRTVCIIHPDNLASIRVATRCGYRQVQPTTYKQRPTVLYARNLDPD